jgi:cytoskeletal protein RodZ
MIIGMKRRGDMPEEKLTLGQYFRLEREKKGLDLKEIEEITKISAQTLRFLEEDEVDMLPPRAFLRGFLQVISKEFDFDEEELVKHLDETLALHGQQEEVSRRFRPQDKSSLSRMLILFIVVFLIIIVFGLVMKKCRSVESHQSCIDAYAQIYDEKARDNVLIERCPN